MQEYLTEQEKFWAGEFGDEYLERNRSEALLASNLALFSKVLSCTEGVGSILEFGANIGMNLLALQRLLPDAELSAIEINRKAVDELQQINRIKVYHRSILDFLSDYQRDLVFTKTVLIHINPENLSQVYESLYASSKRYICLVEYYNPRPVEILYRGHEGKLFKRDFAGEMLERFSDLRLVNYGFVYHRDSVFKQDDITWFLLEKN